jgi:hypothetical protein
MENDEQGAREVAEFLGRLATESGPLVLEAWQVDLLHDAYGRAPAEGPAVSFQRRVGELRE